MKMVIGESQLITLIKAGDQRAVAQWFTTYQPLVSRVVSHRIDSPADVQDVVQEVFVAALRELTFFQGKSSLKTWMISVANHKIADFYRKRYAKKVLKTLPLPEWLGIEISDSGEVIEKTRQVLALLSSRDRYLLIRKYIDDLSCAQLATELKVTVRAIESSLLRARKQFSLLYEQTE